MGQINEIASWLALGVAVYSAAAYGRLQRAAWCSVTALTAQTVLIVISVLVTGLASPVELAVLSILNALPYLLGWPLGLMTRRLREYRAVLEQRNAELHLERETNARRAVLEERVRIARELHDVVAHRLFHNRPDDALEAMAAVQTGSRQVIADLQQLLGVLRGHGDDGERSGCDSREPAPGLRQLPALTARASVTVRYNVHAIEVEVVDDGRGPHPSQSAEGRGLLGMQERVSLHGGRLEVGACPGGGFRVHAVLGGDP